MVAATVAMTTNTTNAIADGFCHKKSSTSSSKQLTKNYFTDYKKSVKPSFHYPSWRPELTSDRFPLPINTGRADGRAFPLAELTGRQWKHAPVNTARVDG